MNYLNAEGISKYYGDKLLFEDITININKGQRVALIAKNGTGKSTLLKIIMSQEPPDEGKVTFHKNLVIGYLDQDPYLDDNTTVLETIFYSDNPTLEAIRHYEDCLDRQNLFPSDDNQVALEKAMQQLDVLNAWDYEVKIRQILSRLEINRLDRPVKVLSGGQRKRVALAAILVKEPDILIMDEPTNHLDLQMIEWLENFIAKQQNLSLLVVTHDRYFLDGVSNEIIELHRGKIHRYKGNYAYFLEKKAEQEFNYSQEVDKARKLRVKELEWLRRSPKARGTKAKSRISAFDKIDEKARQKTDEDTMEFRIRMPRVGGKILELYNIAKRYDDVIISKDFSYFFKRKDRIGIVGKNGVGKTTFLEIITAQLKPDSGKVVVGGTIEFGYYNQKGLQLDKDKRVIDVIRDVAEALPMGSGRFLTADQLLAHFLFPHKMHRNYVSTLSGGEKRRLYLLTVLMKNPNFLILDEPTNDLDIMTLNVLEDFLQRFEGCLVIVSHDRYFMDRLVDHIFVLDGKGKVRDFPGNYSDYRIALQAEEKQKRLLAEQVKAAKAPKEKVQKEKTKLSYNEQREFKQLEKDIEKLEAEKATFEEKMGQGGDYDQLKEWSERMGEITKQLDEKTDRWLELSEYV